MSKLSSVVYPNIERPNAKIRLFCFPYSGSGRSAFHPWVTHFKDTIAPFTIQYPGRGGRAKEPLESNINVLVAEICNAILSLPDKPFAIYAHSLGATIAYEVLSTLKKEHNIHPLCFFASGRPPHINNKKEKNRTRTMTDKELLHLIRNYNLTPDWLLNDNIIIDYYLPILRNDFTIYHEYLNENYIKLNIPIYGIIGEKDTLLSKDVAQHWSANTNSTFHFKAFKGGHFYFKEEHPELISFIENEIERCYSKK